MKTKAIVTAGIIAVTFSLYTGSADAQNQSGRDQNRGERQATREQRLGKFFPQTACLAVKWSCATGKRSARYERGGRF